MNTRFRRLFETPSNKPLQLLAKDSVEYLFLEKHPLVKYGDTSVNQIL